MKTKKPREATRCLETDEAKKYQTKRIYKYFGYRDGDTPEKAIKRLFTGETYEQQQTNDRERKRLAGSGYFADYQQQRENEETRRELIKKRLEQTRKKRK